MEPPEPQSGLSDAFLAYMAGLHQVNRDPAVNNALPAHQATPQQYPAGYVGDPVSDYLQSHVWPPQSPVAMDGTAQFGSPSVGAIPPLTQPLVTPLRGFAAQALPAAQVIPQAQQPSPHVPLQPATSRPHQLQPQRAAHHIPRAVPQSVRPSTFELSQAPDAAVVAPGADHDPAHRTEVRAMQVHAQMPEAQQSSRPLQNPATPGYSGCMQQPATNYAPPPAWQTAPPPPAQPRRLQTPQLPPSRDESASPWSTPIFTPSPTVSTPGTTPGFAFTPTPTFGRTVPLPGVGQGARTPTPQAAVMNQRAHQGTKIIAPTHATASALKRRISDVDEGADEPIQSKRSATLGAKQGRFSNEDTIGRQVQSSNTNISPQRAPASPRHDTSPVAASVPEATVATATDGEQENDGAPATDDDDAGSLFGDGDGSLFEGEDGSLFGDEDNEDAAASTLPALVPDLPDATASGSGAGEPKKTSPTVQGDAAPQLCLPGMDEQKKLVPAPDAPSLALPGMDAVPAGSVTVAGTCPIPYLAGTAVAPPPAPAAASDAAEGSAKKPAGAVLRQASSSNGAPATQPSATQGARKKRKGAKKAADAPQPSANAGSSSAGQSSGHTGRTKAKQQIDKEEEAREAARLKAERRAMANKSFVMQHPELGRQYAWMTAEAGPSTIVTGHSTASAPAPAPATAPATPLFKRAPPDPGPEPRPEPVVRKVYPTSEPAPKGKLLWCKMCWEAEVKGTNWFDYPGLQRHIYRKHQELLDSDVWRH